MSHEIQRITYPFSPYGELTVHRLLPSDITRDVAHDTLGLVAEAYRVEFEERLPEHLRLPVGTIYSHFSPDSSSSVSDQQNRMVQHSREKGSRYHVLYAEDVSSSAMPGVPIEGGFAAVVKVSPSKPTLRHRLGLIKPNCYVDDMAVHPAVQRVGIGSTALHAAIISGNFNLFGSLNLDAYEGHTATNSYFERVLGMTALPEIAVKPLRLNDGRLLKQIRYQTGRGNGLTTERIRLEVRFPWLKKARLGNNSVAR